MKAYFLWAILIGSGLLLGGMLLRHRFALQWLGSICFRLALASLLLYAVHLVSPYTHFELPLNAVTLGVVTVLGIPGLAALTALKLWVVV